MTRGEFEEKSVNYAERLLVLYQDEEMTLQALLNSSLSEDDARRFLEQAKANLTQVTITAF